MSSTTSTPSKTPTAMSSRLLTMKFMQRAAASSPIVSPSTPNEPSSKRRKVDEASPISATVSSRTDLEAVRSALEAEEAIRQAALDRQASEAGDTRWVLNFKQTEEGNPRGAHTLRVVQTGFAVLDNKNSTSGVVRNSDNPIDRPNFIGRRSFGKFNRAIERLQDPTQEESSSSEDEEDEEDAEEDHDESDGDDVDINHADGADALIREAQAENTKQLKMERKKKRKAEKAELLRLAEKRKKKDIKLNALTSISGGNQTTKQACHRCGKVGHIKADCPARTNGHSQHSSKKRASIDS